VGNVFVLGQRFDFATFDRTDSLPTKGAVDELGAPVTLQSIANSRKTIGCSAQATSKCWRAQITSDPERIRNATPPGQQRALVSKGISFGVIVHNADGSWDSSLVEGIPAPSLVTSDSIPPTLVIRPFHQAGNVISLRQFTNKAFNHHHGMQSEERFGIIESSPVIRRLNTPS
jgi:hypothetical protein